MRIVYVDDDEILLEVGQAFLESYGHTVICVNDSREARRTIHRVDPDLVLLDVMMPDMDGVEVLAQLSDDGALAHMPVVFLTGDVEPEQRRRLLDAGAAGVIGKSFTPQLLCESVTGVYEQWRRRSRARGESALADVRILANAK